MKEPFSLDGPTEDRACQAQGCIRGRPVKRAFFYVRNEAMLKVQTGEATYRILARLSQGRWIPLSVQRLSATI